MEYFRDVYLKRLNRFGTTLQERILNQKEYDFHYFVEKSPNRVTVFIQDVKFEGVLETKTYNEIETIDYFLTYKTIPIPTGSILKVESINHPGTYTYWIVIAKANFISAGYYRYTVVKLDREIRWITKEGFLFKALVHISGAGANALNKRITSTTKIDDAVIFLPNQNLTLTMQDSKEIKRGTRVNIKGQVWRISGYDNISNDGVSYVTLEQDYSDKEVDDVVHLPEGKEPPYEDGIADGYKIFKWTFDSNLREEYITVNDKQYPCITLEKNRPMAVDFWATYYDEPKTHQIAVEVLTKDTIRYNKTTREITGLEVTEEGKVITRLVDSPDIEQIFYFKVIETTPDEFSVEGATRIKYGIPTELYSEVDFELISAVDSSGKDIMPYIKIDYFGENNEQKYIAEITVTQIVKNLSLNFAAKDGSGEEYIKIVSVESPWIGG